MKTIALEHCLQRHSPLVTLQFDEFELITLVALVEEGRKALRAGSDGSDLHRRMDGIAAEFTTLLGHLELAAANQ
ncbi:hypothetical protein [Parahaliea aestuarii]|uniref:Uncharacterized protein n=1 Tax=Parahaliea aestuarii TaxID=1852021 RepID=A0A5C8ZXH1_9GAMM|nr:hypothetical protein [Parahaliea aestuarii]TXS93273.1 hypothetical protein FVW59_05375 [Parahaliea aestuarii]